MHAGLYMCVYMHAIMYICIELHCTMYVSRIPNPQKISRVYVN